MQDDNVDERFDGASSETVNNANSSSCDKSGKSRPESPDEHSDDEIIFVPNNPTTWSEKNIETWLASLWIIGDKDSRTLVSG